MGHEMAELTTLEGGLRIVSVEMPHMASESLGLWVGVGGRHEPEALGGVSHFIEHMLFKGTRRRSSLQLSQAVEGVGGYLNAFTTEENTCFYSKACHDRVEELWDVLADMLLNSKFEPGELEKERNVIKEEISSYLDQPHQLVQEMLNEAMWPNHPLGRALTGTVKTLDAMKRRDMKGYLRRHYVAPCTVVAAAGPLRHAEIVKLVKKQAGRFPRGKVARFEPIPAASDRPWVYVKRRPTEQTQISLGMRTCSRHDPRRFALRLMNTVLGENMSSRLFQVVREEKGLAYSIYSGVTAFEDTGVLAVSAGVETARGGEALSLILKEMETLRQKGPSQAEVRRARDYLIGQLELSLENTESQMMWAGENMLGYGVNLSAGMIKDALRAVNLAGVRAVGDEFLQRSRMSLSVVSPERSAQGWAKLLGPNSLVFSGSADGKGRSRRKGLKV